MKNILPLSKYQIIFFSMLAVLMIATMVSTALYFDPITSNDSLAAPSADLQLGSLGFLQGRIQTRRSNESSWYEAQDQQLLFVGDQIKTGVQASAQIQFASDLVLNIHPLSQVSFFRDISGFFFRIDQGFVSMAPKALGKIRAATQKSEIRDFSEEVAREGETLISSVSSAVKKAEEATKDKDEPPLEATAVLANKAISKTGNSAFRAAPPNLKVLLHQGRGSVFIQPLETCPSQCRLVIKMFEHQGLGEGQNIVDHTFEASESPQHQMKITDPLLDRTIRWWLTTEDQKWEGSFQVRPLSPKNLAQALEEDLSTEILE